jgi:hypothetical protein
MGSIRVAWWNLQNLFDTDDNPISSDLEFTVEKGWTAQAFAAKKANLAAVLRELTDEARTGTRYSPTTPHSQISFRADAQ